MRTMLNARWSVIIGRCSRVTPKKKPRDNKCGGAIMVTLWSRAGARYAFFNGRERFGVGGSSVTSSPER